MIALPEALKPVIDSLIKHDTYPVIVGGYVRDALLDKQSKDIDIEVYNVKNFDTLQQLLEPFGNVNLVGKSFGVLKLALDGLDIDFSLPRTESKKSSGHRGFDVTLSGQLDFATAALRRDFTVNAMGYDLNSSYLLDPYRGQQDLKERQLRCVNKATFVEDPLRVLRAVQMAARFHLECDDALMLLCRKMVKEGALDELPKERIFEEFKKLLLKAERPSEGFRLMARIGVLRLFPELASLYDNRQNDLLHGHNDVWDYTLTSLDIMASLRTGDNKRDLTLMLAILSHALEPGSLERFLGRISDEKELHQSVKTLVRNHDKPLRYYQASATDAQIRRLAVEAPLNELVALAKALYLGRNTPDANGGTFLAGEWLLHKAQHAKATAEGLKPLLQGRDLVKAGYSPSPEFKTILDKAYEAQLDGLFETQEGALEWFRCYWG